MFAYQKWVQVHLRPGAAFALAVTLQACAVSSSSTTSYTSYQKASILNDVDVFLTNNNCTAALSAISPLYNSVSSDNDVRLRMAEASFCHGSGNYISDSVYFIAAANVPTANSFYTAGASVLAAPTAMWDFFVQTFPSTLGKDHVVEGSLSAASALQAMLTPGIPVLSSNQINAGTNNVGSTLYQDRLSEANRMLFFTSMSAIGGLLNRYATVSSTGGPTVPGQLSWTSATQFANSNGSDGCALASSVVNLLDSSRIVAATAPTLLSPGAKVTLNTLADVIDQACVQGCKGGVPATVPGLLDGKSYPVLYANTHLTNWVTSGCAFSAAQCGTTCPLALRDRTKCTGVTTDMVSCAAAGVINLLNASDYGWIQ